MSEASGAYFILILGFLRCLYRTHPPTIAVPASAVIHAAPPTPRIVPRIMPRLSLLLVLPLTVGDELGLEDDGLELGAIDGLALGYEIRLNMVTPFEFSLAVVRILILDHFHRVGCILQLLTMAQAQ
jgi:hypothetical protein